MSKPKFHKLQESAFLTDQLLRFRSKPHTWLEVFPYIGGKRNILNTQCLLQWVGSIYARHAKLGVPKLAPEHGYFGPRWNEDATLIHGDLDDLLMTELIPELVASCKGGVFACYTFPLEDQIFPLFMLLKQFMSDFAQPVSISLSFSIHTMLTAIFKCHVDH